MAGVPLIGQSSRSPPAAWTRSRSAAFSATSSVLISTWIVPGRTFVRVPCGPRTTSRSAVMSGRIDSRTSLADATSAADHAPVPPRAASSPVPERR
jgi:hypothetical protein